ncbi:MAG: nitroreductase family protein [Elainellaceae cyanobacterium]
MLSRRNFMLVAGSTAVIVAAGKAAIDLDKMPSTAIAAWSESKPPEADIRKRVLSYALLAPNPHNMQPWLVDLRQPNQIDLYCDRTRLLPQTDPFSRQILIGHGAFLELLDLAASAEGYQTNITYFPKGEFGDRVDDRPVASIQLIPNASRKPDPLFQQILQRRSAKVPFDMTQPLLPEHAQGLTTAYTDSSCKLTVTTDQPQVLGLQGIVQSGMEIELRTPHTYQESVDVMRIGAREVEQHRNGIDLTGAPIGWGRLLGMVSREKLADPTSQAFKSGVTMYRDMAQTTPAFAWMTTSDNTRSTQLAVGRAYARLNLKATALGVAMHPMSQVLQEYEEMQALQKGFLTMLNIPEGHRVQILVRLGYAKQPDPSPRRDLQDLLLT